MGSLLEDLALAGDQLARLFGDTAVAVSTRPFEEGINSTAYWQRVHGAVAILRRAEGSVETLNHETGAHATLPGFVPGERVLDEQLALP